MPIRLNDLMNERREVTIPVAGASLSVIYRPNVITPRVLAQLQESRGINAFESELELLERLIVEWDLVGPVIDRDTGKVIIAEDEPVPVAAKVLQYVSHRLITEIVTRVTEDMAPKAKNSARSSRSLFEDDSSFS